MIYFHKRTHSLCFDLDTFRHFFEKPGRDKLQERLLALENPFEVFGNQEKLKEIADEFSLVNDKEDLEFFTAAYLLISIYPDTEKVCLKMKAEFNPDKDSISDLEGLKKFIKEYEIVDFMILNSANEGREFQLKGYKEACTTDALFSFLEKKLKHYSYNLGTTNLLLLLQSGGDLEPDIFHDIHEKLKALKIKGTGHILISYNENGEFDVMNTVYPILGTTRIPYRKLSERLQDQS